MQHRQELKSIKENRNEEKQQGKIKKINRAN